MEANLITAVQAMTAPTYAMIVARAKIEFNKTGYSAALTNTAISRLQTYCGGTPYWSAGYVGVASFLYNIIVLGG